MSRKRTVARFAIDVRMLALALSLSNIGMASLTRLMTCIVDRACGDVIECGGSVVSVPSKCFGDEQRAYGEEREEAREKNSGKPEEMARVSKGSHSSIREPPSQEKSVRVSVRTIKLQAAANFRTIVRFS